jgi:hypothetical protein
VAGIYNRIIAVHRLATNAAAGDTAIGLVGYSGAEQSPSPPDPQGEITLFTGIPASIQAGIMGRKKDSTLPEDIVHAPTWNIFVPAVNLAQYSVRDRDIILDDEGYRYEVAQNWYDLLGYKLACVRLEA